MSFSEEQRGRKRVKSRRITDLKCLTCRRDSFFEATIFNVSEEGLYLECDHEMKVGDSIRIHLLQQVPKELAISETNESTGIVKWCRTLAKTPHHRYGAGIRFA